MNGSERVKTIRISNGTPGPEALIEWSVEDVAHISVTLYDGHNVSSSAPDLFESLIDLRRDLAARDLLLCCNGARLDCYPSRMSREMGKAQKVLVLEKGKPPSARSMVDIFGEADGAKIGTPEEQESHYRDWLDSIA
ncbi:hypothetical protein [Streptomyces sp. NPDC014733]|uniref:hypothetical protein n=1 Tax=Streptomyces sp. NPDC014733 TaxID=3364885 RepID=UPI0036FDA571